MWWGGAVPKRETKFPKEQIAEVWLVLLSFLPGEMKEIGMGESFACQMELNTLDQIKTYFPKRQIAHTVDRD